MRWCDFDKERPCFGGPGYHCLQEATTICGLCDGHYCDRCIGEHYDREHGAPKSPREIATLESEVERE